MALKNEAVENFFKISQQHANAQKNSPIIDVFFEKTDDNIAKKTLHKPNTNLTQTPHKPNTNLTQIYNTCFEQTEKPNTQPNTLPNTNLTQTSHKPNTNLDKNPSFEILVGHFKKIVIYIYNQCKFNGTYEIILSITTIANTLQIPYGSVNTTLARLEKKGYIKKIKYQAGRGGWKKISLSEHTYREILFIETLHKPNTNLTQTSHKPNTQPNTQPNTTFPSSSSNLKYLKETTTGDDQHPTIELSEDWNTIDIEPLNQINFTKTHLFQIASQNKLPPTIIQDSIYAFAFDLQENNKTKTIKGDPLNLFMGILRNGKPYNASSNYESPQDKAMRLYTEKHHELEQKRLSIEKEAISLAYNDWFASLTNEQKKEFLPEMLRRNVTSEKLAKNKILEGSARNHFENDVWPELKNKIISNSEAKTETEIKPETAEQAEEANPETTQ